MHPSEGIGKDEKVLIDLKPDLFATFLPLILFILLQVVVDVMFLYVSWGGDLMIKVFVVVLFITMAVVIYLTVFVYLRYKYTFYMVTNKRVILQRGIIVRDHRDCKLNRIQNVYVQVGFLDRLLGVGAILFSTAGELGIEVTFSKVKHPLQVKQAIIELMEKAERGLVRPPHP